MTDHYARQVPPFGHPRITARVRLPPAFRSLPRPSSPARAQASTARPSALGQPPSSPAPTRSPSASNGEDEQAEQKTRRTSPTHTPLSPKALYLSLTNAQKRPLSPLTPVVKQLEPTASRGPKTGNRKIRWSGWATFERWLSAGVRACWACACLLAVLQKGGDPAAGSPTA